MDKTKGIIITVLGVLFLIPDSLLVRLITATPLAICFWRGLLGGSLLLIIYLNYGLLSKDNKLSVEQETILYLLILCLICVPIGSLLILTGPKYISASEVSLIILLQVIIAPILAWLILKEYPGLSSLVGGIFVISALLIVNLKVFSRS